MRCICMIVGTFANTQQAVSPSTLWWLEFRMRVLLQQLAKIHIEETHDSNADRTILGDRFDWDSDAKP